MIIVFFCYKRYCSRYYNIFIIQIYKFKKLFLTFALSIITEKVRILPAVLTDAYMVAVDSNY